MTGQLYTQILSAFHGERLATEEKIRSFTSFQRGWRCGEGKPFSARTIENSVSLCKYAKSLGFSMLDAFPGPFGEIALCLYEGEKYAEFVINNDYVDITDETPQTERFKFPGPIESARGLMDHLSTEWLQPSFVSSTLASTTFSLDDSGQLRYSRQQTGQASPSSPTTVQLRYQDLPAVTHGAFTQHWLAHQTRSCSGDLIPESTFPAEA